ncbi:Lipoxygenase [Gracilaria domingensis]|nr:Lipoxygenase [Gracilaria domingensis]
MSGPQHTTSPKAKRGFPFCACFGDPEDPGPAPETVYAIPPSNKPAPSPPVAPPKDQPQNTTQNQAPPAQSNDKSDNKPSGNVLNPVIDPANFKSSEDHQTSHEGNTIQSENKAPEPNHGTTEIPEHDVSDKPHSDKVIVHEVHSEAAVHRNVPADVTLTLKMFAKAVEGIGMQLFRLANEWHAGTFSRKYMYEKYPHPIPLPRRVVSLPQDEAFSSSKVGAIVERAHTFLRSQMPFVARLDDNPRDMFADVGYDAFRAFFGNEELFPMPRGIISSEKFFWRNDTTFAAQFLTGCNPTVIEMVTSMEVVKQRMPKELIDLRDPEGRTVPQLVEQQALLWADYSVLAHAARGAGAVEHPSGSFCNSIKFDKVGVPVRPMVKHFYAPFVAFYVKSDGQLGVLGIILTRHTDGKKNEVYNEETCKETPNTYIFAKMHVACADNQMHQFYAHLGRCHLVFEPFGVALRNIFKLGTAEAQQHIVGKLLGPHFRDHLAINWLARNTLVAHGEDVIPFTEAGFALGAKGGLVLLGMQYSKWRLSDQAFPQQLRNRGFDPYGNDKLQYYYRDDGMMVWNAMKNYVDLAIRLWYNQPDDAQLDEAIANDEVLKSWCKEMRDVERAAVESFPACFKSSKELSETVTTIMYNVSAEHSAVNGSQERYLSYVPNRPNALFRPVPSPSAPDMNLLRDILMIHRARGDDDDVGASMPLAFAMFQVQFSQLLTLQPTYTLMALEGNGVPEKAVALLKRELEKAHHVISFRNMRIEDEHPELAPYEFLDPINVAQSIEI